EVLLARFNKTTGACIALTKIPGDNGFNDVGTALAVDASGDYILGGGFGHHLYINGNTLTNNGAQSDFFIAKYATTPCSPLDTEEKNPTDIKIYPNPVGSTFVLDSPQPVAYSIYSVTGQLIANGSTTPQDPTIDSSSWAAG